ncbi:MULTISPECIES: hypothetical protein [unclassified Flavobacterium]|jgi:hypothetical protein|uniref:hypothetical protein n=1 Tax=unclassified Flavobacterium TaxID=196869 RepID=UPI0025C4A87D|nr:MULTISPECIES: hypothetical protein [unclassified Flavobacterium]
MDFSIFSSFLPEGLLSHFDIVDFKELGDLQTKKDCLYELSASWWTSKSTRIFKADTEQF